MNQLLHGSITMAPIAYVLIIAGATFFGGIVGALYIWIHVRRTLRAIKFNQTVTAEFQGRQPPPSKGT